MQIYFDRNIHMYYSHLLKLKNGNKKCELWKINEKKYLYLKLKLVDNFT